MFGSDKKKVREILIATRYGISASEIETVIHVKQDKALKIIQQLIKDGEDIQKLDDGNNLPEFVLYSIGKIEL